MAETVVKKLPAPVMTGGKPLMEAIAERKTIREFKAQDIDEQTLSEILWTAFGISHDGKRTIPTALNKQDLQVYVAFDDGVWLYDGKNNELRLVSSENPKPFLDKQDYMKDAGLTLIFTGSDAKYSPLNAGAAYQNVGLYCASRGLNNVVRGYFDRAGVARLLGVGEDEVIITQTVGWPYM